MEILEYTHCKEPMENRKLFGMLGEYATSSSIRKKLGGFISSELGRRWFVATVNRGKRVVGFGSLRFKAAGAELLHLYALDAGKDIPVLERCIEAARETGVKRIVTTDYAERKDVYVQSGFRPVRENGRFIRFELELGHD